MANVINSINISYLVKNCQSFYLIIVKVNKKCSQSEVWNVMKHEFDVMYCLQSKNACCLIQFIKLFWSIYDYKCVLFPVFFAFLILK